jgi:thiosulfate/3-mercaptopyruvate sulfurtransferase
MKKVRTTSLAIFAVALISFAFQSFTSQKTMQEPWTAKQLMPTAELAKVITEGNKASWYVYSVGPGALIKNSIDIGQCRFESNLSELKKQLSKLPKDANIVIYCGCCPFANCPNIRPSFGLLNEMKFTNHKLLNIPQNIKTDWIDKGYPIAD